VPSTYSAAKSYPLVIAMHGDYGDGPGMRGAFQLDGVAGQDVIVAYPTGTNKSWQLYTPVATDSDVAFLSDLVGALKGKYSIRPTFAFGMSAGAFMANQVACRRPTLFKGIISHSGGAPDEPNDSHGTWGDGFVRCNGQDTGVAAMIIHGTLDTTVPYPSGEYSARYWAKVNGCGSTSAPTTPSPCVKRDGCPGDKPVVYCSIDGLGHNFWSEAPAATWAFVSGL